MNTSPRDFARGYATQAVIEEQEKAQKQQNWVDIAGKTALAAGGIAALAALGMNPAVQTALRKAKSSLTKRPRATTTPISTSTGEIGVQQTTSAPNEVLDLSEQTPENVDPWTGKPTVTKSAASGENFLSQGAADPKVDPWGPKQRMAGTKLLSESTPVTPATPTSVIEKLNIKVVNRRNLSDPLPGTARAYIGRPSPLGNPYVLNKDGTREEVIAKYRTWLWGEMEKGSPKVTGALNSLLQTARQQPLELDCFCAPESCHGDVIKSALHWMHKNAGAQPSSGQNLIATPATSTKPRQQFLIDSKSSHPLGRALSPLNARLSDGRTIEQAYQEAKGYKSIFGPGGGKGKPALTPNFDYEGEYQKLYDRYAMENPQVMAQLRDIAQTHDLVHPRARTTQNPATALTRILNTGAQPSGGQNLIVTPESNLILPKYYAGIGSRRTPPHVLDVMTKLASKMEGLGYILRSGGASGADSAFDAGVRNPQAKEIYLPGSYFNSLRAGGSYIDATTLPTWQQALGTVNQYHPAPERLQEYGRRLMARNAMQVLGRNLNTPARAVIAWTPRGGLEGGTAQALRIAMDKGIPVKNLGDPKVLKDVVDYLNS